jgi:transposase
LLCDREQELLLPPSLRDWLAEDHLAWFVLDAVERMDLEAFYASYRRDGWGRAAHDPQMMVALLVYAYAIGERSSRAIERRCREDVAYRVIAANALPDHATVARFRVRHETALADLFGQVLALCADAGLVSVGVLAVDGSKFAADASDGAIRTYEQIAAEILREADELDAAEDDIHGPARGDELPAHLAKREGRQAWLNDAKQRLDRERAERAEPVVRGRTERLSVCQRRLVEDWQAGRFANRDYEAHYARGILERGRKAMGSGPRPFTAPARPEGKLNTTDPDAKRMKVGRTFIPAYNAQAVTTEQQIVIAAEVTTDGGDFAQLEPMIVAAQRELDGASVTDRLGVVLADAGYWSNGHIDALRERGIIPIIAPDSSRNKPRKTRLGGPYDFMRRVLKTEQGGALYSQRQWMIEPVFGQIKANRRINRFKRRGLAAARSEWRLITATHNLLKLHRHTPHPAAA